MEDDDLSLYQQILILAVFNKKFPDHFSQHRTLARWFSNNFSTPYKEAENMTFEELLFHKLEWDLDNKTQKEADSLFKKEILKTKKESLDNDKKQAEDDAWALSVADKALKEKNENLRTKTEELLELEERIRTGEIQLPGDIKKVF